MNLFQITLLSPGEIARRAAADPVMRKTLSDIRHGRSLCATCPDPIAGEPPLWIEVAVAGEGSMLAGLCLGCFARLPDDQAIFAAVKRQMVADGIVNDAMADFQRGPGGRDGRRAPSALDPKRSRPLSASGSDRNNQKPTKRPLSSPGAIGRQAKTATRIVSVALFSPAMMLRRALDNPNRFAALLGVKGNRCTTCETVFAELCDPHLWIEVDLGDNGNMLAAGMCGPCRAASSDDEIYAAVMKALVADGAVSNVRAISAWGRV